MQLGGAKKVETVANISIIIVAVVATAVLVKNHLFKPRLAPPVARPAAPGPSVPATGSQLSISGVDWAASDRTLLVVVSTGCHFCSESAPFYQRLTQETGQ